MSDSDRKRREFVKLAAATGGISTLGLAGCLGDDDDDVDDDTDMDTDPDDDTDDDVDDDTDDDVDFPTDDMLALTGHSTGGGFDLEIRTFAEHASERLGVDVQVNNMTGAGGQVMHEHLMDDADDDGHTFAQMNGQNAASQFVLEDGPDPREFQYIGQKSQSIRSIIVRSDAVDGWDDFVEKTANDELLWATTDPAGGGALIGIFLGELTGLWTVDNIQDNLVILEGTGEVPQLMGSDDVDVLGVSHGTAVRFARDNDFIDFLSFLSASEPPEHVDLPEGAHTLEDVDGGAEVEDAISQRRMLVAPPGVPDDRVEILRDEFGEILQSDEFQQDLIEADRSPNYLPHDEALDAIDSLIASREENRDIFE